MIVAGFGWRKRIAIRARQPEGKGTDRILVFEDTNGDGKFDKRTVFMEGLNLVSGLEVGFGGVWVGAAPEFLFIPMKDGDEPKPAGPPQVLLDGWGYGDTHETLNTFTWGPDGWLYGCHGVFTQSNVGKPGAPDAERTRLNAGIWRYHPIEHRFELFSEGTSNPWGIDFDKYGQCIIEGCVIPHLWHMIQAGHFQRQAGEHFNPYVFDDIKTIADHVHWAGGGAPHAGNGRSASAGGGHAHAGLMVYQGASWPEQYNGQAFMNNIHGARINMDILEAQGSGFVGHHGQDFILFNDLWSQIVNLQYDQDGSLYMIDWYDKNQCHNADPAVHDRTNGRIFKVVYNDQKTTPVDLQKLSGTELVALQLKANDWWVRHSRRILEERGPNPEVHAALRKILLENPDPTRRVRALWALHATRGLTEELTLAAMKDKEEHVRAWAIQLACEDGKPSSAETSGICPAGQGRRLAGRASVPGFRRAADRTGEPLADRRGAAHLCIGCRPITICRSWIGTRSNRWPPRISSARSTLRWSPNCRGFWSSPRGGSEAWASPRRCKRWWPPCRKSTMLRGRRQCSRA